MAYSSYYAGYSKQITLYLHLFLNAQVLCCYLHKREKSARIWVLLALFSIFPLSVKCWLSSGRHLDDIRRGRTGLAGERDLQLSLLQKAWLLGSGTLV